MNKLLNISPCLGLEISDEPIIVDAAQREAVDRLRAAKQRPPVEDAEGRVLLHHQVLHGGVRRDEQRIGIAEDWPRAVDNRPIRLLLLTRVLRHRHRDLRRGVRETFNRRKGRSAVKLRNGAFGRCEVDGGRVGAEDLKDERPAGAEHSDINILAARRVELIIPVAKHVEEGDEVRVNGVGRAAEGSLHCEALGDGLGIRLSLFGGGSHYRRLGIIGGVSLASSCRSLLLLLLLLQLLCVNGSGGGSLRGRRPRRGHWLRDAIRKEERQQRVRDVLLQRERKGADTYAVAEPRALGHAANVLVVAANNEDARVADGALEGREGGREGVAGLVDTT